MAKTRKQHITKKKLLRQLHDIHYGYLDEDIYNTCVQEIHTGATGQDVDAYLDHVMIFRHWDYDNQLSEFITARYTYNPDEKSELLEDFVRSLNRFQTDYKEYAKQKDPELYMILQPLKFTVDKILNYIPTIYDVILSDSPMENGIDSAIKGKIILKIEDGYIIGLKAKF